MSKQALQKMLEIETTLAKGTKKDLVIGTDESSTAAVVSYFLRHYRGRSDLASAINTAVDLSFVEALETARTYLATGSLEEAEKCLYSIQPKDSAELAEYQLEYFRLRFFQGNLDDALAISDDLLSLSELSEISRMTCFQLRGHCWIMKSEFKKAVLELTRAVALAGVYPAARSAFSASALLVQAHAELGERKEAEILLQALQQRLSAFEGELWIDRLLIVLRAEALFCRSFSEHERCLNALIEAKELASWLGEKITVRRCEAELAELLKKAPLKAPQAASVYHFAGWCYFTRLNIVLGLFPKQIFSFQESPLVKKILITLSHGPLDAEAFFAAIWGFSYIPERHYTHLKATLSNVRKSLPKGALIFKNGIISLK